MGGHQGGTQYFFLGRGAPVVVHYMSFQYHDFQMGEPGEGGHAPHRYTTARASYPHLTKIAGSAPEGVSENPNGHRRMRRGKGAAAPQYLGIPANLGKM